MTQFIDIFLNLDKHIAEWIILFGPWLYVILFLVIFAETGLVVTPFLPGDSLLFAIGAFTVVDGGLNLWLVLGLLTFAGILGDGVNYHVGQFIGPKIFVRENRFIKRKYLLQTQEFYEKWGTFTIVAARFAPIVRTFAPFIAGVGSMPYRRFVIWNIIGAFLWVWTFVLAGHFFGNLPVVKRNFHIVIFGVIGVSLIPVVWPFVSEKIKALKSKNA